MKDAAPSPARLALGLAALAAERIRGSAPGGDTLATVVGLAQRTVYAAGRLAAPPARLASRGVRWAAELPGAGLVRRPIGRVAAGAREELVAARARGRQTVAAGRVEAVAFVQSGADDGLAWVRAKVLPVLIEDLAADPRIRDLVVEQSRGMLDDAAEQLRSSTETADDRVESAFRRLLGVRGRAAQPAPGR
ncbi:MAG TPA: hypothetical protein VFE14_07115 [Micromonosporaceae bacterium]|nr:hypothetical protein [Micromonosporaceae bacterium]